MTPRVPERLLAGCDPEGIARMREHAKGYARFVSAEDIGTSRYFRFESPKAILEVPVEVLK